MSFDVIIYHNPACGTSRNTLALIRNAGIEPHIIAYLASPPTAELLRELAGRIGGSVRDLVREKDAPQLAPGVDLAALTEDQLLALLASTPALLNRPIVVTPKGVRLCRPSETVLDLLPPQRGAFRKEDGACVVDAAGQAIRNV